MSSRNRVYHLYKSVSFTEKRPRKPLTSIKGGFDHEEKEHDRKNRKTFSEIPVDPLLLQSFHWNVPKSCQVFHLSVLSYGRPFVSKLWHDIRAVFPTYTCNHSCYTIYVRAFFCHVYLRSFLQTRIYMRTKKSIYMRYKQAYGVTESRRIRGTELYRHQKTPSCTTRMKSNFSLNQAWPQWPG